MVTATDVERIAHLARLHLTPEESAGFAAHLSAVLDHAAALSTLALDDIPPTATVSPVQSVVREGDLARASLPRSAVLANAPFADGASFVVQATLGDGGS